MARVVKPLQRVSPMALRGPLSSSRTSPTVCGGCPSPRRRPVGPPSSASSTPDPGTPLTRAGDSGAGALPRGHEPCRRAHRGPRVHPRSPVRRDPPRRCHRLRVPADLRREPPPVADRALCPGRPGGVSVPEGLRRPGSVGGAHALPDQPRVARPPRLPPLDRGARPHRAGDGRPRRTGGGDPHWERPGAPWREAKKRIARALRTALRESDRAMVLLEGSAGRTLGGSFEELREILDAAGDPPRLGVCLDTAHLFAAGWDVRTSAGWDDVVAAFDRVVGRDRLRVLHLNDSKAPLGSGLDRHENIGRGRIGPEGFRAVFAHPALRDLPGIIETPGFNREGPDRRNIAVLKRLRAEVLASRRPEPSRRPR